MSNTYQDDDRGASIRRKPILACACPECNPPNSAAFKTQSDSATNNSAIASILARIRKAPEESTVYLDPEDRDILATLFDSGWPDVAYYAGRRVYILPRI